jgi:ABC-type transport system involved in multi-copper enzyme maturation permease subunit
MLLITRFTLLEAIRRRLFLAVLVLSMVIVAAFATLLHLAITATLHSSIGITGGDAPNPQLYLLGEGVIITVLSIWMVYLLSSTLTIVFTANMISGEVEAGTFAILVPKPLTRTAIVAGKWLGYALIVCTYTALMFLAFLAVIRWQTGYWPGGALYALSLLELGMLALLGLTTLGSALVPTIVNGAVALILFIGAPMASTVQFVVQLLNPASAHTIQSVTTVIDLIMPTDALWHGASYFLLPPSADFLTLGIPTGTLNTPFTSGQPAAPALLIWAALYCIALPALAALRFAHRDL